MRLGDEVTARTADGVHTGRITGRTFEAYARYDVMSPSGALLINIPEKHISLVKHPGTVVAMERPQ